MENILKAIYKMNSINDIKSHYKKKNLFTSTRWTFKCKYLNRFYLISSAHNLANDSIDSINDEILSKFKKILIPEIDLVIYEISNLDLNYIDLKDNKYSINDVDDKKPLYFVDENFEIQNVNIHYMEKCKYNNACYPDMLKYIGKSNCNDIEGSSGSPIFDDDCNIYGILSGFGDEYLNITPFFFVKRILDELIQYNSFSGLCNFWHDTKILRRNLVVAKKEEVNYNLYQKSEFLKLGKLLKNDEILSLDDKNIINGMIFSDLLNMEIDIDSYITITKTIHCLNSFYVYRSKNLFTKYFRIHTGNRDIYSAYNINMKDDLLFTREVDNKVFIKINPMLFNYISGYRPVHLDNKLMNVFKLKQSEIFENNYLLVEDKLLKKNILEDIPNSYLSVKM